MRLCEIRRAVETRVKKFGEINDRLDDLGTHSLCAQRDLIVLVIEERRIVGAAVALLLVERRTLLRHDLERLLRLVDARDRALKIDQTLAAVGQL